jgi:hypothetical protein
MNINKTGGYDHLLGVDGLGSRIAGEFAYGNDLTGFHGHIAIEPAVTGAVDNSAVRDQYIASRLRFSI